ncbi:MAG: transposase [Parachlamydiaceae bacterium]|nr:transposase [Parachlamydiaceae bacterium]
MKKVSIPKTIPERAIFISFDIDEPMSVPRYQRNLPHLRLEGATYFVTFRLADSIPQKIMESWIAERNDWLAAHGLLDSMKKNNPELWNSLYFTIPFTERRQFELQQQRHVLIELDNCHGDCLLENSHNIVAKALDYFHGQRVWIGDYVVMPNHVHVIIQPFPGVKLEDWLYSVKRFSSTNIVHKGQLWQAESFDRIIRTQLELLRTRKYIANNPTKLHVNSYSLKQMDWLDEYALMPLQEP